MPSYTVILTDAEDKAIHHVAASAQDWIENAIKQRCRLAMEEISSAEVKRRLANNEVIQGSMEDIVLSAPIKTALEIEAESLANFEAAMAARNAQQ